MRFPTELWDFLRRQKKYLQEERWGAWRKNCNFLNKWRQLSSFKQQFLLHKLECKCNYANSDWFKINLLDSLKVKWNFGSEKKDELAHSSSNCLFGL